MHFNKFDTTRQIFSVSSQVDAGKIYTELASEPRLVFLRNFVRNKKNPLCYEVELIESNSKFSNVHFKDGKKCTVSTKDLAPKPFQGSACDSNGLQTSVPNDNTEREIPTNLDEQQPEIASNLPLPDEWQNATEEIGQTHGMLSQPTTPDPRLKLRRKAPIPYGNPVPH